MCNTIVLSSFYLVSISLTRKLHTRSSTVITQKTHRFHNIFFNTILFQLILMIPSLLPDSVTLPPINWVSFNFTVPFPSTATLHVVHRNDRFWNSWHRMENRFEDLPHKWRSCWSCRSSISTSSSWRQSSWLRRMDKYKTLKISSLTTININNCIINFSLNGEKPCKRKISLISLFCVKTFDHSFLGNKSSPS